MNAIDSFFLLRTSDGWIHQAHLKSPHAEFPEAKPAENCLQLFGFLERCSHWLPLKAILAAE
jgi:hypothetical protein